jgi:polyhydroxybutyrate depolymerase
MSRTVAARWIIASLIVTGCAPAASPVEDGGDSALDDGAAVIVDAIVEDRPALGDARPFDEGHEDSATFDGAGSSDGGPLGDARASDASVGDASVGARSGGCGRAPEIMLNTWVSRSLTVASMSRAYYVRLPTGYDSARAYPVVYQFHGCSTAEARQDNNVPVHNASGADAIIVRGRAAASCWDTSATGPDLPYIDAMMAEVEASFCVDTTRRFANGYSSGAFMTHRLGCVRGALFRGVGSIAGGQGGSMCTGNVAAMLIHDTGDSTVNISASVGARDDHVRRNGCSATAPRMSVTPPPCEAYAGCAAGLPVVWCQTTGQNHGRQDALAAPAFWNFFRSLPPR